MGWCTHVYCKQHLWKITKLLINCTFSTQKTIKIIGNWMKWTNFRCIFMFYWGIDCTTEIQTWAKRPTTFDPSWADPYKNFILWLVYPCHRGKLDTFDLKYRFRKEDIRSKNSGKICTNHVCVICEFLPVLGRLK